MQKKCRIKIENGEMKFIDPINLDSSSEGIIIFFNDIKQSIPVNKCIKGSFPANANDFIETDIKNLREDTTNQIEKKFKNWNM